MGKLVVKALLSYPSSTMLLAAVSLLCGCGMGMLQTARPASRGIFELNAGTGMLANSVVSERTDGDVIWSVAELGLRLGLTDHLDVGTKLQFFPGALVDMKYNFMEPDNPLALSVRLGVGGSIGIHRLALHVPASLGISYDWPHVTPYAHVGWSNFWFNSGEPEAAANVDYVEAKGHGDGVLRSTVGLRFRLHELFMLFVEYNYWEPMLNDEGDFYKFDNSHAGLVGLTFRTWRAIF